MREQRLRTPDATVDADGGHAIEGLRRYFFHRLVAQQHRVVDDGVDAAASLGKPRGGLHELIAHGDIDQVRERSAARGANAFGDLITAAAVDIGHCHCGATTGQFFGHRPAQAACGAGDEDVLTGQIGVGRHAAHTSSFHAWPSGTIRPALGSAKWLPMTSAPVLQKRCTKSQRVRAAWGLSMSKRASVAGTAIWIGLCIKSPVMTARSPRESISTLACPGVWPGVAMSETSSVRREAASIA